jgi:hypothetical protein
VAAASTSKSIDRIGRHPLKGPSMNDPRGRQAAFNASSRGQWDGFAGHRRKVSALLGAVAALGRTRLCVLGVGNGNDLDLPALLEVHREVHLVDLDPEALERGVGRQGVAGHPSLHLHGGIDVTGMLDTIATWSPRTPIGTADLEALAEWPSRRVAMALPEPFDLVASTCLLSPLIGNAYHAVGEGHPRFLALVQAIRAGHLRLLTHLAAPGGTTVLVTDVASTDTFPALGSFPESSLPGLLRRLADGRGFFHGVAPAVLSSAFRNDPVLRPRVAGLEWIPPWRWNLHERLYLVLALRCRVEVGPSR